MKLSLSLSVAAFLSASVEAASSLQVPSAPQPASKYPIGAASAANASIAKTSGRLFDIDGEVQYFAGKFYSVQ